MKNIFKYFNNNYFYYSKFFIFCIVTLLVFFINSNIFAQQDTTSLDSTIIKRDTTINIIDTNIIISDTATLIQQVIKTDTSHTSNPKKIIVELVDPEDYNSLDYRLFRTINYNRSKFKNSFIPFIDRSMLPVTVLMPFAMFGYGRKYDKTYDENTGYLLSLSQITNFAITFGTKMIVKRKRVRVYFLPYGIYPRVYTKPDPYSFPSGHTSSAITAATMLVLRYPKYPLSYLPLFTWAGLVGYGRIYLGMHYPSDVLVGAMIGAGSSALIFSLRKELLKLKNNVLNENKPDEGSINGGTVSIFAACMMVSSIYNIIFNSSKVTVNASPFIKDKTGVNFNINYKF